MEGNKSVIVDNISVRYRKADSRSTADIVKRMTGKSKKSNEFWALKNISFTLEKGDMLGVIGRNGAGKSTLMKTISGTLVPASGSVRKEGKLCALLELATGFDREMTVRENVFLRGALLGYPREFIESKYDEIIDYADMREFENNPFRTLSSGMKSRIAFAIASMVKPDIIILDEVFAVGDGDFKKKSQQTMKEIIGDGGTTALMVSHSLDSVRKQCNKVLWLHKGQMVMFGEPEKVCDAYAQFLKTKKLPEPEQKPSGEPERRVKPPKTKKRGLLGFFVYLALLILIAGGMFFWSQYDLFRAYDMAKHSDAASISAELNELHDGINDILGVDASDWDYAEFAECAAEVDDDGVTLRSAAKEALGEVSDKYELSAAELQIVRDIYTAELETLLDGIKADYESIPISERPPYLRFAYSRIKSLYSLEKSCDADMQSVIDGIRSELETDGLSENNADRILSAYKEAKVCTMAYYIQQMR